MSKAKLWGHVWRAVACVAIFAAGPIAGLGSWMLAYRFAVEFCGLGVDASGRLFINGLGFAWLGICLLLATTAAALLVYDRTRAAVYVGSACLIAIVVGTGAVQAWSAATFASSCGSRDASVAVAPDEFR